MLSLGLVHAGACMLYDPCNTLEPLTSLLQRLTGSNDSNRASRSTATSPADPNLRNKVGALQANAAVAGHASKGLQGPVGNI